MANEAAFELKEAVKEHFDGATTAVGEETFDIKAELDKGHGYIVTDDERTIRALDGVESLKRAQVGDAKAAKKKRPSKSSDQGGKG